MARQPISKGDASATPPEPPAPAPISPMPPDVPPVLATAPTQPAPEPVVSDAVRIKVTHGSLRRMGRDYDEGSELVIDRSELPPLLDAGTIALCK